MSRRVLYHVCRGFGYRLELRLTVWHALTRRMKPNAVWSMSAGVDGRHIAFPTAFLRILPLLHSQHHALNKELRLQRHSKVSSNPRWVAFRCMYRPAVCSSFTRSVVGFAQQGSGCDLAHRCSVYLPRLCLTFPVLTSRASQNSQWQPLAALTQTQTHTFTLSLLAFPACPTYITPDHCYF